ncbi:YrhB domain-containing protein [Amycolatopsis pithecellobii]|uniref:YrhB domain-containing protein n=1 Tax=Amycolatopsis pithecellobii TaxID=664692 RepID=UPI0028ACBB6C|nr:YrhB domain-containing protein [Amycolatopsis pithecellobii]
MNELAERAQAWLSATYGDLVTLESTEPVLDGRRLALFNCRHTGSDEPLLAATLCVPKDGGQPFPAANADPLDEDINLSTAPESGLWRWRLNARNCLVATDAAIENRPATALPWQASDEEPGWWDRLVARYFPGAEISVHSSWTEISQVFLDSGEGTKGVVWLQRKLNDRPLTGHLLYVDYNSDGVIVIDGQRGSLAELNDAEVGQLVLARFHRVPDAAAEEITVPWENAAPDFEAAVEKAGQWLKYSYSDEAVLVSPDPEDELERGWLFACTTSRFVASGDWRDQMLDAAVVVPKEAGKAPFGLPNRDPWGYLEDWDDGKDLPEPPPSGVAAWYSPTIAGIGEVASVQQHPHWGSAFEEITAFPTGTRALVWVRRKDIRGRESVGHLLWAINENNGIQLIDPTSPDGQALMDPNPFELRVIRVAG